MVGYVTGRSTRKCPGQISKCPIKMGIKRYAASSECDWKLPITTLCFIFLGKLSINS